MLERSYFMYSKSLERERVLQKLKYRVVRNSIDKPLGYVWRSMAKSGSFAIKQPTNQPTSQPINQSTNQTSRGDRIRQGKHVCNRRLGSKRLPTQGTVCQYGQIWLLCHKTTTKQPVHQPNL
ncbi:hypothetical protein AVEN_69754-1 [Araneus ventricosus]|uniref:Uncharacterized protein n=1 Tax=Araneus ventricosus TaxID=182803 RepID=A0A4Y2CWS1_ARAVE|nr:hypothetical protein AVEN_69754-1 [Araneus ventricosus]